MSVLVKGVVVVVLDLEQCGDAVDASVRVGDELKVVRVRDGGCDYYANGKSFYLQNKRVKLTYPNQPHKHAGFIKAWADGVEIQFYNKSDSWKGVVWGISIDPIKNPDRVFRIKPTKSAKDIKLEELEANMRKLADEIKELRDE